jgi:hypothetical protein
LLRAGQSRNGQQAGREKSLHVSLSLFVAAPVAPSSLDDPDQDAEAFLTEEEAAREIRRSREEKPSARCFPSRPRRSWRNLRFPLKS